MKIKILAVGLFFAANFLAQTESHANLEELKACLMRSAGSSDTAKGTYVSYQVKATNWDNEVTLSNAKLYELGENMNFFSEHVTIFRDKHETVVIIPSEKLLVINETISTGNKKNVEENSLFQKALIDSSKVLSFERVKDDFVVITLRPDLDKLQNSRVQISSITYEFNPLTNSIRRVIANYTRAYKLKQVVTTYKEHGFSDTYHFKSLKTDVLNKKGNVSSALYPGYELVDNREAAAMASMKK